MAVSQSRKLAEYRKKRDFSSTPEPQGGEPDGEAAPRFTIQEHHATALHWDFRLERDGVLVSWAVPRGLPRNPKRNNLAVHTEDHPLDYLTFHGVIPEGYGAGKVILWDVGTYECEKFRDDEVIVTLHGERAEGKYVLFQTKGKDWMIHRMDPPVDPSWLELPETVRPMVATVEREVPKGDEWAFEVDYGGLRTLGATESGRLRLTGVSDDEDLSSRFPEVRLLGEDLGMTQAVFDGEIVVFGSDGKPDRAALERRMRAKASTVRRVKESAPAVYVIADLLQLEGRDTRPLPLRDRRKLLEELLPEGEGWQVASQHVGDGEALLQAANAQGVPGLVAKRLDSAYVEGHSRDWRLLRPRARGGSRG